jgi:hypothetical protein
MTPDEALVRVARLREIERAAEAWARVRRDPTATRAALRAAEDALLRALEGGA